MAKEAIERVSGAVQSVKKGSTIGLTVGIGVGAAVGVAIGIGVGFGVGTVVGLVFSAISRSKQRRAENHEVEIPNEGKP